MGKRRSNCAVGWRISPLADAEILLVKSLPYRVVMVASLSVLACSDPQALPGELDAILLSPNGREGAASFEIDAVIDQIEALSSMKVYSEIVDNRTRVIVVARAGSDLRFRFFTPDVHRPPAVRILDVAGPTNALRPTLDEYFVDFVRVQ